MIKALVLDVDGVIVGEEENYNCPNPHFEVINALKQINSLEIPIILCTGRPQFCIQAIVDQSGINNYHVSDSGGLIMNPLTKDILEMNVIEHNLARKVVEYFLEKGIYTEIYTYDNYYIQSSHENKITQLHAFALNKEPIKVESLSDNIEKLEITKIMIISKDEEDKILIDKLFKENIENLSLSWGTHPIALPAKFGAVNPIGISKKYGIQKILTNLNISFKDTLSVGDSDSDWIFMEPCGYVGTLENVSDLLKDKVNSKGKQYSYIGKSVDNNGILDILKFFELI